jgi:hypothetical protein
LRLACECCSVLPPCRCALVSADLVSSDNPWTICHVPRTMSEPVYMSSALQLTSVCLCCRAHTTAARTGAATAALATHQVPATAWGLPVARARWGATGRGAIARAAQAGGRIMRVLLIPAAKAESLKLRTLLARCSCELPELPSEEETRRKRCEAPRAALHPPVHSSLFPLSPPLLGTVYCAIQKIKRKATASGSLFSSALHGNLSLTHSHGQHTTHGPISLPYGTRLCLDLRSQMRQRGAEKEDGLLETRAFEHCRRRTRGSEGQT